MRSYEYLTQKINDAVSKYHEELITLNDDLADHPEISAKEFESSRKIVELLKKHGFDVEYPYADIETAFKATFGKGGHKHKVAVLTEYDALPGVGHACGHCVSGSISVLAGIAASAIQDDIDCDIHVIGTPDEEMDGAKCRMADKHLFDDYDFAIMIHLYDRNLITCNLLALVGRMYNFHGKAAHGATSPWDGINALNAAQLMMHGIDCYRQHVKPDVRIHGIITNGGLAANVVPEESQIKLYSRSLDARYLAGVNAQIENIAQGAALMTGCTMDWYTVEHPYDDLRSCPTGVNALTEVYKELGLEVDDEPDLIFGSSDVGNVSYCCPTFHSTLNLVERGIAIHTRDFEKAVKSDRAHELIATGAKVIAYQIAKLIGDETKAAKLHEEFLAQ